MTKKIEIIINIEKCTGCLFCGLYCSMKNYNLFNPMVANIKVERNNEGYNSIVFTDSCNGCGTCAKHCFYGGLKIKAKERKTMDKADGDN